MLVDDLIALLFDVVLWLGQLIVEVAVALLAAASAICMWTGRALFRLLGRNPYREIVFLSGATIWATVGAIIYIIRA
jgi:hypothetical protein